MADYGQASVPNDLLDVEYVSVSASRYHTCAVRVNGGQLDCWGFQQLAEIPADVLELSFSMVSAARFMTCGITSESRVKCWGPGVFDWPGYVDFPVYSYWVNQYHVPASYADMDFVSVSASFLHVCATRADGAVVCWGADANPSTPEVEMSVGTTLIFTGQAAVPPSLLGRRQLLPVEPTAEPTEESGLLPAPTAALRILRIEPAIREVNLRASDPVQLTVNIYGRQDILDNSLSVRHGVAFEWTADNPASQTSSGTGRFGEADQASSGRTTNDLPDDRQVLYTAPGASGRVRVTAALEPGAECLGKQAGESDQDVLDRCSAVFEITVQRPSRETPTAVPPRNPSGEIPSVLVDGDGTNYEVFTPEDGGAFSGEGFGITAPPGAVPDGEVIGVNVAQGDPATNVGLTHHRYTLGGDWYNVAAIDADGALVSSYVLDEPAEICVPLPAELRGSIVGTSVVAMKSEGFAILSSRIRLGSGGGTQVCASLSELPAQIAAARLGAPDPLPTPIPTLVPETPDTGGRAPMGQVLFLIAITGTAVFFLGTYLALKGKRTPSHAGRRND